MSKKIGISLIVFATTISGSYFLVKRFLKDRQAAANYEPPADSRMLERRNIPVEGNGGAPLSQPNAANEAAVQRSLKTIEEINKINEMNRRLTEQQQRMQKQK